MRLKFAFLIPIMLVSLLFYALIILAIEYCCTTREALKIEDALSDYESLVKHAIQNITGFNQTLCDQIADGVASNEHFEIAGNWTYQSRSTDDFINLDPHDRCSFIKTNYGFNEHVLSNEELNFRLAYGILAHTSIDQLYYMVSAFYQPQNVYCIVVDRDSSEEYKEAVIYMQNCFSNIKVLMGPSIGWCRFSIIVGVQMCLRYLTALPVDWKYYQYLSGFDLPLKTNRQMVRIFKRLNGSFNVELSGLPRGRLGQQYGKPVPFGAQLYKSSLSATFSRQSADFIVKSKYPKIITDFLKLTKCPDESLWATLAGNYDKIPMPGAFNASEMLAAMELGLRKGHHRPAGSTNKTRYYISRFQSWIFSSKKICSGRLLQSVAPLSSRSIGCCRGQSALTEGAEGKWIFGSCAFGVRDIRLLLRLPQLVVHKFRLKIQPAGFFCVYSKIRLHALRAISEFDDKPYGDLPGPRKTRNEPIEHWFEDYYDG